MSKYSNFTLFITLAAVWGASFMAIKAGLAYFPPIFYASIRFYIAGCIMLIYATYETPHWFPHRLKEWGAVFLSGILMFAVYHTFLYIGELYTTSAVAAVIVSLSPLITSALTRKLLPEEHLSYRDLSGIVLGFCGIIVIARPHPENLFSLDIFGKALIFLAVASFALGSVLQKRFNFTIPQQTMIAWSMLIGAVMMHIGSILRLGMFFPGQWTTKSVFAVAYLSIISGFIGYFIYFKLLNRLGPLEINLVSYITPFFAGITGWIFLGENIEFYTVLGFAIIFSGFILLKNREVLDEIYHLKKFFTTLRSRLKTNDA